MPHRIPSMCSLSMRTGSGNGPSHPSQTIRHLPPQAPFYNLDSVPPNQTFHPSMPAPLGRYSTSHCCDGESVLDSRPRALFNEILPVMNQYRDTILWTLVAQGIPKFAHLYIHLRFLWCSSLFFHSATMGVVL